MFLLHSYLTFVIKSNTHFNTHAGPIESIMYNCINYMESNRCKSIYLAEIQSLCISGGVEFELYIRVKYWPDSNTKLIRSPKVAKLGAFFQHWLNCSSHIQSSHEPDRGLGGSILSRNGLWPEFVFVYLYFCICVFVRQIKVWAGLLVLAKVSNQNCHKSQVAPPVLAGPLTNCGQWKVLKILSVIITKHTIGMKDSRHHSGLQFTVEMLKNITDDMIIAFVQLWWL